MKKIIVLILLASSCLRAQIDSCIRPNDWVIQGYYGMNILASSYRTTGITGNANSNVIGIGPVGIIGEKMLSPVIGLGGEVGYTGVLVTNNVTATVTNGSTTVNYADQEKFRVDLVRAMIRMSVHFSIRPKLNAYFLIATGYRKRTESVIYQPPGTSHIDRGLVGIPPIGFKFGFGIRYFVTDKIGICYELSSGTPFMSLGIAYKLSDYIKPKPVVKPRIQ